MFVGQSRQGEVTLGGTPRETKQALSIAGTDPAGGAGIQADLKTFAAHRVYGLSVVTVVVAQACRGVRSSLPMPKSLVCAQLRALVEDICIDAAKTGALGTGEIIDAVLEGLPQGVPLVVDPVLVSSSGAPLLEASALARLPSLFRRAALVTPNATELDVLLCAAGLKSKPAGTDVAALRHAAQAFFECYRVPVLAKGGHVSCPGDVVIDILVDEQGAVELSGSRVSTTCTRGTGCTLSAAITAQLALGQSLRAAVAAAVGYLREAMSRAQPLRAPDHLGSRFAIEREVASLPMGQEVPSAPAQGPLAHLWPILSARDEPPA